MPLQQTLLGAAVVATALYAAPVSGLHVLSAVLVPLEYQNAAEPNAHRVALQLSNPGNKTIVAYVLELQGKGADGAIIPPGWPEAIFDHVHDEPATYAPYIPRTQVIPPGRVIKFNTPHIFHSDVVQASASVLGVVYEDRTFEGDVRSVFNGRSMQAHAAEHAIGMITPEPRPSETRKAILALLELQSGPVNTALEDNLHRAVDANNVPDDVPKGFWRDVRSELEQRARYFEEESRPQTGGRP